MIFFWGWIFLSGISAGFVNVLAGGGSLFSLTSLLLLEVPNHQAIATNRIACVFLACAGLIRYRQKGIRLPGEGWRISLLASIGAFFGAMLLSHISTGNLDKIVLVFLFLMFFLVFFRTFFHFEPAAPVLWKKWLSYPAAFCLGIYGGFFGVAVSMFFVMLLVLLRGETQIRALALTQVFVFTLSLVASFYFIWEGLVLYPIALVLGFSMALGAFLGVSFAVRSSEKRLRWIFFSILFIMIVRLSLRIL